LDVIHQFKKMDIILIKQIDMLPEGEIDVISLN
jgi:hypothetical protein